MARLFPLPTAVARLLVLPCLAVGVALSAQAQEPPKSAPSTGKAQPSCSLVDDEAPRGGQLEIKGQGFGRTPVVRIGKAVTRILLREKDLIAVQIPRDSNGGAVTVQVDGERIACGALTIIGKNR